MQFNPYMARATLVDPSTSQGGINNLLNMQQQSIGDVIGAIGNIGKASRTKTVNDLIARGGLEGLNEAQTQARIQAEAGGTLTPEGQQNVDRLLQTVGKQDQRQFTTQERLGGQEFLGGENTRKLEAEATQEQLKAEALLKSQEVKNALEKELKGMELTQREKDSLRDYNASMYGHKVTAQGQKLIVQGDDGMQYYADKATGKLIPLVKGTLPAHAGDGSGSSGKGVDKLTGEIKKVWEDSTGKGKLALEEMYKTGNLQVVPIIKMDKDGQPYKAGQKMLYKGQPTTTAQLKAHLGLK